VANHASTGNGGQDSRWMIDPAKRMDIQHTGNILVKSHATYSKRIAKKYGQVNLCLQLAMILTL